MENERKKRIWRKSDHVVRDKVLIPAVQIEIYFTSIVIFYLKDEKLLPF